MGEGETKLTDFTNEGKILELMKDISSEADVVTAPKGAKIFRRNRVTYIPASEIYSNPENHISEGETIRTLNLLRRKGFVDCTPPKRGYVWWYLLEK